MLCVCICCAFGSFAQNFHATWPNGERQQQGDTLGGVRVGEWSEWYDNGEIRSIGAYEKGQKVGLWKYWHNSGKKWKELNLEEGLCFSWYENGGKEKEGSVRDGKEEGLWQYGTETQHCASR